MSTPSSRVFQFTVAAAQTGLPSWVPAANTATSYTPGASGLLNTFRSVVAPYYSTFYSLKVINDFSSGVANPYLGSRGGVVFRGAGHSASNDNGVYGLVAETNGLKWYRLSDPTGWFGTGTDGTTQANNSITNANALVDQSFGDALPAVDSERQPPAAHTYGYGDIIPPADGGAANGTFFSVASLAWNHANGGSLGGAHYLTLPSATATTGNAWSRAGSGVLGSIVQGGPMFSQYVSSQRRTYVAGRYNTTIWWFDHQALTWTQGSGSCNAWNSSDSSDGPDNGAMVYIPTRNILVCISRVSGALRIHWIDVTATQPTQSGPATLSAPIYVPAASNTWHMAAWCPDNGKLLIGQTLVSAGGALDTGAMVEVDIPATLTNAWTVTRRPFASGTVAWGNYYGLWQSMQYLPAIKSLVFFPIAYDDNSSDRVFVIRPHGT